MSGITPTSILAISDSSTIAVRQVAHALVCVRSLLPLTRRTPHNYVVPRGLADKNVRIDHPVNVCLWCARDKSLPFGVVSDGRFAPTSHCSRGGKLQSIAIYLLDLVSTGTIGRSYGNSAHRSNCRKALSFDSAPCICRNNICDEDANRAFQRHIQCKSVAFA